MFGCPSLHLSVGSVYGKHSIARKNEDIAHKFAKEFEKGLRWSEDASITPTSLCIKNGKYVCFLCFLLVTHKLQLIHDINIKFYSNKKNQPRVTLTGIKDSVKTENDVLTC